MHACDWDFHDAWQYSWYIFVIERTLVLTVNVCFFFIFVIRSYWYTNVVSDWVVETLVKAIFFCPTFKTPWNKEDKSSEDSSQADQADWFSFDGGTMGLNNFFITLSYPSFFSSIISHQGNRLFDFLLFYSFYISWTKFLSGSNTTWFFAEQFHWGWGNILKDSWIDLKIFSL